jgi:hypothetical protein
MQNLARTPLLFEAGAFRHLRRIERDASPEELKKLRARKKWLDQRQNLRFARSRSEKIKPENLKRFGVDPEPPKKGHPSSEKKHYPSDYRSPTAW